jgi:hypothetical protein
MSVGIVALVAGLAAMRPVPLPATTADGAAVYARLGCPACHSLGGRGNTSIPLDGVGRRLEREALRTWIVAPQRMKPGVRKPAYDRVPPADVDAVVDLLADS